MSDTGKKSRGQVILEYVQAQGEVLGRTVVDELAKEPWSIPSTTTFAYLTQLCKQKLLVRSGLRRNFTYRVPTAGESNG